MSELEMISPKMIDQYRNRQDVLIIDLRAKEEYQKYHIASAVHIDYDDVEALFLLPRWKMIILYCERGASSMTRAKEMVRKGYRVKSLLGGMNAYKEYKRYS